jgi:hypothetical protein
LRQLCLDDAAPSRKRFGETKRVIENRKHVRHPGNSKAAIIYTGPDAEPIMCTLDDISEGGAGLTVVNTKVIPDIFHLEIKGEGVRRLCKVAWKKEPHRLGVWFAPAS